MAREKKGLVPGHLLISHDIGPMVALWLLLWAYRRFRVVAITHVFPYEPMVA